MPAHSAHPNRRQHQVRHTALPRPQVLGRRLPRPPLQGDRQGQEGGARTAPRRAAHLNQSSSMNASLHGQRSSAEGCGRVVAGAGGRTIGSEGDANESGTKSKGLGNEAVSTVPIHAPSNTPGNEAVSTVPIHAPSNTPGAPVSRCLAISENDHFRRTLLVLATTPVYVHNAPGTLPYPHKHCCAPPHAQTGPSSPRGVNGRGRFTTRRGLFARPASGSDSSASEVPVGPVWRPQSDGSTRMTCLRQVKGPDPRLHAPLRVRGA